MKRLQAASLILLAACLSGIQAAVPRRIVSINLCSDQLLLMLAEPRNIASVTYLAADPLASPIAELAQGIAQNYGQAEEILALKPDLVLASVFTAHSTNMLLRKLGIPVLEIPVATNIAEIRANIRAVSHAIGDPAEGDRLLERFEKRLAAATFDPPPPRAVAALYRENNVLYGANTIAGSFTQAAGLENLADRLGLAGFSDLPLEILIEQQPDIVIEGSGSLNAQRGIRAYRSLQHPALAEYLKKAWLARIPDRLWACGSPAIIRAVRMIADTHRKWRNRQIPEKGTHEKR